MSIASTIARAGHTLRVLAAAVTTGAMMDKQETLTAGSLLRGWVQPAGAALIADYSRREIEVTHIIYFSADPGAKEGDRLLWVQKSMTLALVSVRNVGGLDRFWEAVARALVA